MGQEPGSDTELFSIADRDAAIVFPVDPSLDYLELLVRSDLGAESSKANCGQQSVRKIMCPIVCSVGPGRR